jgi:hypothetical protein
MVVANRLADQLLLTTETLKCFPIFGVVQKEEEIEKYRMHDRGHFPRRMKTSPIQ